MFHPVPEAIQIPRFSPLRPPISTYLATPPHHPSSMQSTPPLAASNLIQPQWHHWQCILVLRNAKATPSASAKTIEVHGRPIDGHPKIESRNRIRRLSHRAKSPVRYYDGEKCDGLVNCRLSRRLLLRAQSYTT